jgi:3-oxoacyl-[acyl-carrier-protein] synthase-1
MNVYAGAENIITSLGFSTPENLGNIIAGRSGIAIDESKVFAPIDLPLSKVDHRRLEALFCGLPPSAGGPYTPLEKMIILSITASLAQSGVDITSGDTLIIISSTKGNIDLLDPLMAEKYGRDRIFLHEMARAIGRYFANPNTPMVVSNACVSGVLGIICGERLIRAGRYRNVVVCGGDLMHEFIVSGFLSFQSLSMTACKPFDRSRDGLTLGEGCATIILSDNEKSVNDKVPVTVQGGAGSNDANHISGPSRTGEGLYLAIKAAMKLTGTRPENIDTISAHGTATDYNDEMEAKAFSAAGLEQAPLNSYKGYIGHTLGAAGVIEAAISLQSMRMNMLFRSAGYEDHGVSKNLNVIRESHEQEINTCLKTASGFGGSNAAVIFRKI